MTGTVVILIGILLTTATVRMARGHWMPVHSDHVGLNIMTLTIADIPVEELGLDPAEIDNEKWAINKAILGAQWRLGLWAKPSTNPFTITGS